MKFVRLLSEIRRVGLAGLAGVLMSGCGDSGPTKVPTAPPTISCPANQTTTSVLGAAVPVIFPAPTVAGGATPVTTACAPASGANLPVGNTSVTCTARDAQQRTSSCSFAVNVVRAPSLTATKFMAFGDSITAGLLRPSCPDGSTGLRMLSLDLRAMLLRQDGEFLRQQVSESPSAYPIQLATLLTARYLAQSVTVVNEGRAGEEVTNSATFARFQAAVSTNAPEALLLQEGINDVHQYASIGGIPEITAQLGRMVREAKARGVRTVYLGTLLPERAGACRNYAALQHITQTNALIRSTAISEGALLVDLYQAFGNETATLLGFDGLHPTEAGYQRIASTFFDAIQATLETR